MWLVDKREEEEKEEVEYRQLQSVLRFSQTQKELLNLLIILITIIIIDGCCVVGNFFYVTETMSP